VDVGLARLADAVHAADHLQLGLARSSCGSRMTTWPGART
jgi:hypothetical protein